MSVTRSPNPLGPQDLRALWRPREMLIESHGDELMAAVNAGFILPTQASSVHIAVAANIAARLGFEATAIDLPLPRGADTAITFAIGRDAVNNRVEGSEIDEALLEHAAAVVMMTSHCPGKNVLTLSEKSPVGLWAAGRYVSEMAPDRDAALTTLIDAVTAVLPHTGTASLNAVALDPAGAIVAFRLQLDCLIPPTLSSNDATVPEPAVRVVLSGLHGSRALVRIPRPFLSSQECSSHSARPSLSRGDLSKFYRAGGAFETDDAHPMIGRSDYLICLQERAPKEIVDLAARVGLEAVDLKLPLVCCNAIYSDSSRAQILIESPQEAATDQLGGIFLAERAGDDTSTIHVSGDAPGISAALTYLSQTCPHLREYNKGLPELRDAAAGMGAHLSSASPAGQAAAAIVVLDAALDRETADEAHVIVDRADLNLEKFLNARWPGTSIRVHSRDVRSAATDERDAYAIACDVRIQPEVAELRSLLKTVVVPALGARPAGFVSIFAGLSEAPEVRRQLEREIGRSLRDCTGAAARVTILSAYKPGYSWLAEQIIPRLIDTGTDEVIIRIRRHRPPSDWPHGTMFTPTRWLHEIYPIDAVFCEKLCLPNEAIRFEMVDQSTDTYEVVARRSGETLLREAFSPRCITRPLIDHLPDYERVQVTTGWLDVHVASELIYSSRIATDSERFWDHYQSTTLPGLAAYVMRLCNGRPDPSDAPFFGELRVEVSLSEPDYRLGIGEEVISAIDALHEEIYLSTRRFFEVLGLFRVGAPLTHVGRIIPIVRATQPGEEQYCRIRFRPFAAPFPAIRFGSADALREVRLSRRVLPTPRVVACTVDKSGLQSISLAIDCDDRVDNLKALRNITYRPGPSTGQSAISTRQLMLQGQALDLLAQGGLYTQGLSLDGVPTVELHAAGEVMSLATIHLTRHRARGFSIEEWASPAPFDADVDCTRPVAPSRADSILAWMSGFPQALVYRAGESYLGKPIWAVDLTAPIRGRYNSRLKRTVTKPTVMISARQHANEVSSTSHALQFAHLVLTDREYGALLKDVNFVIHPIHNRDGAELVAELSALAPNLLLHAAYFGVLGIDVGFGYPGDHPIMPESRVRLRLWDQSLPDVILNPHGQPAHEWVMPFSEYVGWALSRTVVARSFWAPRPWFIPDGNFLRGAQYSTHREAVAEILRRIRISQEEDPLFKDMSAAAARRYRRYTVDVDPIRFNFPDDSGTPIYFVDPLGQEAGTPSYMHHWMNHYPDITIWQGVIEAPDEPCSGEALSILCARGLRWIRAVTGYLQEAAGAVERLVERDIATTRFVVRRVRPAARATQRRS